MNFANRPRVLIVDDDDIFSELVRQWLEAAGIVAATRTKAFGTLNSVSSGSYGVIVLDVNMPGLPGDELAELIRKLPGTPPKVLLCSNLDERVLKDMAAKRGAEYITKSAGRDEIVTRVRGMLQ